MKSKFERKLEKVKEEAIKENVPIIMDETLQKIKATLKELNKTTINKILEIGTATGYSALCFSELLTDNGEIDTIERDEERIAKAKENINILDGMTQDVEKECYEYEEKIKKVGGINLFLGGVGEDGHIAFNEPGSSLSSRTRKKDLTYDTILANSRFFENDMKKVPTAALTIGVGTLTDSDEIIILADGYKKSRAVYHGIEGGVNHLWTISALQLHKNSVLVIDEEAASDIKVKTYRYFKEIGKESSNLKRCEDEIIKLSKK